MRAPEDSDNVERLLRREARAHLPFRRLLHLYLDPGALFKDASRGPAAQRRQAASYNRRMRWMLLPYMRRWLMIAVFFLTGIEPAGAMSLIPAAAFAVSGSIAATILAVTSIAYFMLGTPD